MKFYVCRTTIGESVTEYNDVLQKYNPDYQMGLYGDDYTYLELSAEQIVELVKELDEEVIIRKSNTNEDMVLEIYDDFRE